VVALLGVPAARNDEHGVMPAVAARRSGAVPVAERGVAGLVTLLAGERVEGPVAALHDRAVGIAGIRGSGGVTVFAEVHIAIAADLRGDTIAAATVAGFIVAVVARLPPIAQAIAAVLEKLAIG